MKSKSLMNKNRLRILLSVGILAGSCATMADVNKDKNYDFQTEEQETQVFQRWGDLSNQPTLNTGIKDPIKPNNKCEDAIKCIELPPMRAVITYITFAPNWLGGAVGIGYALSYAGAGGGIGIVNVNMSTLDGCSSTSKSKREADAKQIYLAMKNKMERLLITADDPSPELTSARRWLNVNSEGSIFKVTYPDGSRGFFRVDLLGSFGLNETACG